MSEASVLAKLELLVKWTPILILSRGYQRLSLLIEIAGYAGNGGVGACGNTNTNVALSACPKGDGNVGRYSLALSDIQVEPPEDFRCAY